MATLTTDDVTLHYEQTGDGPDIVWICGGGGLPEATWIRYQLPQFGDFRNTVFHNRGIGRTECRQELPWTISDFARDTAALIEQVCSPPVITVGKSMGALIAMQLACDRPDLVRLSIPMGTLARSTGWCHDYMRAEIDYRKAGGSLTGLMGICHYAAMLHPADELGDPETWEALKQAYANFDVENERSLIGQWDACDTFDVTEQLPACPVPMHIVAFAEDVQAPPQYGQRAAELAGAGVFHLLPDHGHCSLWSPMRAHEANTLIRSIIESARGSTNGG